MREKTWGQTCLWVSLILFLSTAMMAHANGDAPSLRWKPDIVPAPQPTPPQPERVRGVVCHHTQAVALGSKDILLPSYYLPGCCGCSGFYQPGLASEGGAGLTVNPGATCAQSE